jgi:hypothetical protein
MSIRLIRAALLGAVALRAPVALAQPAVPPDPQGSLPIVQ